MTRDDAETHECERDGKRETEQEGRGTRGRTGRKRDNSTVFSAASDFSNSNRLSRFENISNK